MQDNSLDILYYANYIQKAINKPVLFQDTETSKKYFMSFRRGSDILPGVECLLIYGVTVKLTTTIQEDLN